MLKSAGPQIAIFSSVLSFLKWFLSGIALVLGGKLRNKKTFIQWRSQRTETTL